jgi:hypothetical protein
MVMLQHSLRPLAELMHPWGGPSRCFRNLAAFQLPSAGQSTRRFYHEDNHGLPTRLRAPFPLLGFFRFVPEKQACVVERFGRYSRILNPGLNVTIPIVRSSLQRTSMRLLFVHAVRTDVHTNVGCDHVKGTVPSPCRHAHYWRLIGE